MTFNYYIPPKTYAFLVKTAEENGLSTKEIQRIFLNKVASDLGFSCDLRIGFAKEDPDHKPYCKDCWTRLRKINERVLDSQTRSFVTRLEYRPVETFLDTHYKEQARKKSQSEFIENVSV